MAPRTPTYDGSFWDLELDAEEMEEIRDLLLAHHYDLTPETGHGTVPQIIRRILAERTRLQEQCLRLMLNRSQSSDDN